MSEDQKIGYGLTEFYLYEIFGYLVDGSSGMMPPDIDMKKFDSELLDCLISKFKRFDTDVLTKIFNKWNTSGYGHEQIIIDVKNNLL